MEFSFKVTTLLKFRHEKELGGSVLEDTEIDLMPSPNITYSAYVTEEDLPTKEGVKVVTTSYVQGLLAITKLGTERYGMDFRGHVAYIMHEIIRTMEEYEQGEIGLTSRISEEAASRPVHHTTDNDLVEDITARNTSGDYNRIIDKARRKEYHDFKQPKGIETDGKLMLLDDLDKFAELADIRQRVIDGYYDELSEPQENEKLSDLFRNDVKSDQAN